MARITPKTNWVASDIPVATDFNRIENNSEQAFDELDAEVAARIADVNAEEAARIAADNAEAAARIANIQLVKNFFATGPGNYIAPGFLANAASTNSTTYIKLLEFKVSMTITARIRFGLTLTGGLGGLASARIYKNGTPFGTEQSTSSAVSYSEDLPIAENDLIQVYAKSNDPSRSASVGGFSISTNGIGLLQ